MRGFDVVVSSITIANYDIKTKLLLLLPLLDYLSLFSRHVSPCRPTWRVPGWNFGSAGWLCPNRVLRPWHSPVRWCLLTLERSTSTRHLPTLKGDRRLETRGTRPPVYPSIPWHRSAFTWLRGCQKMFSWGATERSPNHPFLEALLRRILKLPDLAALPASKFVKAD